jgi:uncharacterized protein YjbI with pentapeptide repeats
MTPTNFTNANLSGMRCNGFNYFISANLTGANLRGANLTDTYLTDANLTDANLADANLEGAYMTNITTNDNTIFTNSIITNIHDYDRNVLIARGAIEGEARVFPIYRAPHCCSKKKSCSTATTKNSLVRSCKKTITFRRL